MKAILALANGATFTGEVLGVPQNINGEVVFNTTMNLYEDVLFDPAQKGKIVCFTYPEIGNYGVDLTRDTAAVTLQGLIVKSVCNAPSSSFESKETLAEFMVRQGLTGISGIDTRALTQILRDNPGIKGGIFVGDLTPEQAVAQLG